MKTFTQMVGTTDSTSFTTYGGAFTTLANNNSQQAVTFGKQLVNDQYRYLLQKYFDNEASYSIDIIGAGSYTLTADVAVGDTSATLTTAWTQPSCQQWTTFSSGDQRQVNYTHNSTSITWDAGLQSTGTTAITTIGVRDYKIPTYISKIKDVTITVGGITFPTKWVQTRGEWDAINVIPYGSDIPLYVYVWDGTLGIWPIPQTTNNVLNFNYKSRVADLSFDDYSTGNITALSNNNYTVTGTATSWSTTGKYPLNTNLSYYNLALRIDTPYGDGMWYPIQSFESDTSLTLAKPVVNAPNITSATTYTIGQLPILQEDFQDLPIYGALRVYYESIVKDEGKFKMFTELYNEKMELMDNYLGSKAVDVDLESEITQVNPNLFYQL